MNKAFKFILFSAYVTIMSLHAHVVEITSLSQLQNLLNNNSRVAIKFYSNSCPPCKAFAPIFASVSQDSTLNSVVFAAVNASLQAPILKLYGVKSLPTTIFVHNNTIKERKIGIMTSNQFKALIKSALSL